MRPYESEPKPLEARGEALPVNRNTEDVREAETVLAGLPARMRIQLLIKRTGLKQAYKAGRGIGIRTPDRGNAVIKKHIVR